MLDDFYKESSSGDFKKKTIASNQNEFEGPNFHANFILAKIRCCCNVATAALFEEVHSAYL